MLPNFLDFVSLGKDVRKIKHSSLAGWHEDERAGLGREKARQTNHLASQEAN